MKFEWSVNAKSEEMEIRLVWRSRGTDGDRYVRNKAYTYKSPGALRRDNERLKRKLVEVNSKGTGTCEGDLTATSCENDNVNDETPVGSSSDQSSEKNIDSVATNVIDEGNIMPDSVNIPDTKTPDDKCSENDGSTDDMDSERDMSGATCYDHGHEGLCNNAVTKQVDYVKQTPTGTCMSGQAR